MDTSDMGETAQVLLKRYFYATRDNRIIFLGRFPSFSDAYDFADYDLNVSFVWIYSEDRLREMVRTISGALEKNV